MFACPLTKADHLTSFAAERTKGIAGHLAQQLFLSIKTVEAHRERIKEKLKLKNGAELLRYAMQFTLDGTATGKQMTR